MSYTKQITVEAVKLLSEGDGKRGHWKLYAVKDTDGAEYTTFDLDLGTASPGEVFDVEVEYGTNPKNGKPFQKIRVVGGDEHKNAQSKPASKPASKPPAQAPQAKTTWGAEDPAKSKQIRRLALIKAGTDIAASFPSEYWADEAGETSEDEIASFIVSIASKLEGWVNE